MPRHDCFRKGCTRIRSEFSAFLSRRRVPRFEGHAFCSEAHLQAHVRDDFIQRWHTLARQKVRSIPRPRLGAILMQTAFVTREQLDEAVRLQRQAREGRLGEWLLYLGFVEEHQVTVALAKQFGLPLIDLKNSEARSDAVKMIPAQVAISGNLLPVSYDDDRDCLRVAVSGPVNFNLQEAIRRMIGKGISTYIGDQSAIQSLLARWYEAEERDLREAPAFSSLEELLHIVEGTVSASVNQKATDLRAELLDTCFWARLDLGSESQHYFYRRIPAPVQGEGTQQVPDAEYAMAAGGVC